MFEYENDKLSTQSDEKAQKLKGASEKARNLKDVVVSKDEKKTKGSHGETGDALPMLVPSMLFWVQNVQLS